MHDEENNYADSLYYAPTQFSYGTSSIQPCPRVIYTQTRLCGDYKI